MRTIYSETHRRQDGKAELHDGQLMPCFEMPRRAEMIMERVRTTGLGPIDSPRDLGEGPLRHVHKSDFVDFLKSAWTLWQSEGRTWDALPLTWMAPGMRRIRPHHIDGLLSYYSYDAGTPITAGTWEAIYGSAQVALTGAALLTESEKAAFALCRPPGHHAGSDFYGGYCFLNNAAIAAQYLRDQGAARVAILDVDYHHGNGTQEIFYDRDDILTLSIHADPRDEYPFFLGHADETGVGKGEGYHVNYPLPFGTRWQDYQAALQAALARIRDYRADMLVVSLGVDTFAEDPISHFKLLADDYPRLGAAIATLNLPALFVMEGGYAVEALGVNAVSVLQGFENK